MTSPRSTRLRLPKLGPRFSASGAEKLKKHPPPLARIDIPALGVKGQGGVVVSMEYGLTLLGDVTRYTVEVQRILDGNQWSTPPSLPIEPVPKKRRRARGGRSG